MAGGYGGRSLEETPTWAVACVCFALVAISIVIEHIIHMIGKWLMKRNKKALNEALEKIKAELMLMGFISLLLTVFQGPISEICISKSLASTWHPCSKQKESGKYHKDEEADTDESGHRRLLSVGEISRRILAAAGEDKCAERGQVPFVSSGGIHQLHIFIFVLALFHVLYCILTLALSRAKMRTWETWEMETKTADYQFSHDPERFRFARDTSFGRRHLNFWSKRTFFLWIACFFRQFFRSVPKVDYLTLRHGFVNAHLAPHSQTTFDFQKYINRSVEEDFKVVVGISPLMWFFAVIFLLCNTHSSYSYLWLPFIPLIILLIVGTKLQVNITKMGLRFHDKGVVIKGSPLVQPADDLFWFGRPRLLLYLIHFVLFQNAFQLAFFAWSWYEFSLKSCFHEKIEDIVIRLSMGIIIQILCSYVTLPLYALVTQMGSTMNSTIFDDKVATAIRHWHHTAKKHVKQGLKSGTVTPLSSRPGTPSHSMSPVHLLNHYTNDPETGSVSPRTFFVSRGEWEIMGDNSTSPRRDPDDVPWAAHNEDQRRTVEMEAVHEPSSSPNDVVHSDRAQHEIDILPKDFSFGRRSKSLLTPRDKPQD